MTTVKWVAVGSGTYSFNNPANWQFNAVPGSADLGQFNTASNFTITGNATVGGIEVDQGLVDITGALTLSGSLATDVNVTGGELLIDGSVQGPDAIQIGAGTLALGSAGMVSSAALNLNSSGAVFDISLGGNQTITALSGVAGSKVITGGAGQTLTLGNNGSTFAGVISGNAALTIGQGFGTLTLTGANTYSGGTTLFGTLAVGNNSALGTGPLTIQDSTELQAAANNLAISNPISLGLSLNHLQPPPVIDTQSNVFTLSGVLSGGQFIKLGTGTLILSNANTYTAGTQINTGTIGVANNSALGSGQLAMANGTTLQAVANNLTIGNAILNFSGAASTIDTQSNVFTLSGAITNAANLTKIGSGTLVLSGSNTYTNTTLSAGTLSIGNNNALGAGALAMAAGTTLSWVNGGNFTIGNNIAISGSANFAPPLAATQTINGVISDGGTPGVVNLLGLGTLVLTAANTYSGGTSVGGGATLVLGPGGTAGTAATITDNGTVDIRHTDTFQLPTLNGSGNLVVEGPGTTIMGGGTFSGGTSLGGGTLRTTAGASGGGAIAFLNGGTPNVQITGVTALANAVTNFASGDVIDFANVVFNQLSYAGGVLTMQENGSTVDTLTVSTPYASPTFHFTSDGQGGTKIELSPAAPTGLALLPASDSGIQGDNVTDVKQPTIIGFGTVGDTVQLFDGASQIGSGTVGANGQWSIVTNTPLALGAHSLTATQSDFAGMGPSSTAMPLSIVQSPSVNDVNGDNMSDIVLQNDSGQVGVWEMNALNVVATGAVGNPGPSWHVIGTGDFNGDGKSDILLQENGGAVGVWEMNGFNLIATGVVSNPGPSWHAIATGDFNGDGKSDIVLQNTDGTVGVWEMSGLNQIAAAVVSNPGPSWKVVGTGDFFGNGLSDILLQNSDGTVGIWEMNGLNRIGAAVVQNPGTSWHAIGTGDVNGDGKVDILLQNDGGQVGFWEMNGFSMIGAGALQNPGAAVHAIGAADFNGDGKSDVLLQGTNGQVSAWQMNGLLIQTSANLTNPGTSWHVIP